MSFIYSLENKASLSLVHSTGTGDKLDLDTVLKKRSISERESINCSVVSHSL